MKSIGLGLLAFAALSASLVRAEADSGSKAEQAACRPDVRKFCAGLTETGDQKYRDCLQANFSQLSQNCQHVLKTHSN